MDVNVFLLCYNEKALLPHAVKHYKKYLPSCNITIYDNESTDGSPDIARNLGCSVISWNSENIIDDFKYVEIKDNCWKHIEKGWIIMADMDEFLCVTEDELSNEMQKGTSILQVKGYNMIGESTTIDLSDIDLQEINKSVEEKDEDKHLCFLREKIEEIYYACGAHTCNPVGNIIYSSNTYINKHMSLLGLEFFTEKNIARYNRSHRMRDFGMAHHYTDKIQETKDAYLENLSKSIELKI